MNEDKGRAGASARREYERRAAWDERRIREKWGPFGSLAVALSDERQRTRSWNTGAAGEERVGEWLDRVACEEVRVLHDRRIPGTRANIDHLVVTADAVWVIDTKRYKGRPSLRVGGGLFRRRVEKLIVNGRDKTPLVDSVLRQVAVVENVVPGVPVLGVLCFVDADWPLFGGAFAVRSVDVTWPRDLTARITRPARGGVDVAATASVLSAGLRPA